MINTELIKKNANFKENKVANKSLDYDCKLPGLRDSILVAKKGKGEQLRRSSQSDGCGMEMFEAH